MNFEERFHQLTGKNPYPWQTALYNSVLNQNVPHRLSLPTGAGKTSVVPIWLSVLWYQLENRLPLTVPRRLYFAVDRRVVVDQSELVAQVVRENAESTPLWQLLSERTLSENPLIVSVLRGQRVLEYDDIISDPSAFAIILCTPDMVFHDCWEGPMGAVPASPAARWDWSAKMPSLFLMRLTSPRQTSRFSTSYRNIIIR